MKLYGNSKCPPEILEPLLKVAAKAAGARHRNVIVVVNRGKCGGGVSGGARSSSLIRGYGFLPLKTRHNWHATDAGWFRLVLPRRLSYYYRDTLELAKVVYRVAIHEWVHVRDFQYEKDTGERLAWDNRPRRASHDDRPEEVRAIGKTYDAIHGEYGYESVADAILNLAIWIEEH